MIRIPLGPLSIAPGVARVQRDTRSVESGAPPARYTDVPSGRCTLHWGRERTAHLLIPHIPPARAHEPTRST